MRIQLRPYHPTYVVGYFGQGYHPESYNSQGFNSVIEKIRSDPDLEVELVEGFDSICSMCERRVGDEKGCVWGENHSCSSSNDPEIVRRVTEANSRVLRDLDLRFGSVIKLRDLVELLRERIPVLDDDMIGGPQFQEKYEKGLAVFSSPRQ